MSPTGAALPPNGGKHMATDTDLTFVRMAGGLAALRDSGPLNTARPVAWVLTTTNRQWTWEAMGEPRTGQRFDSEDSARTAVLRWWRDKNMVE